MSENNNALFIGATRGKLRFATNSGHLSTEDLWDLSLKDLDRIAVNIDSQISPGSRKSFLENPDRKSDEAARENELRLEVLKLVIEVKQAENKQAKEALTAAKQREFLIGLRDKKRIEALESLTEAEIEAQIEALGGVGG